MDTKINSAIRNAQVNKEQGDRKPGKSAHGKRGGDDDTSGGSRQGNAGHQGERQGSFGNR